MERIKSADVKKAKESLSQAEGKLASLEERYVMNEIEKDSYSFMKPKFQDGNRKVPEQA